MFGETIGMTGFWLLLVVVFALAEAATVSLVSIWFAAGALVAMILSIIGVDVGWQVVACLVVTAVTLIFTRKIFVEKLNLGKEKTNTDVLVGKTALVISEIKPFDGGRVKVNGIEWKAVFNDNNSKAEKGEEVIIDKIEGAKLVVKVRKEGE